MIDERGRKASQTNCNRGNFFDPERDRDAMMMIYRRTLTAKKEVNRLKSERIKRGNLKGPPSLILLVLYNLVCLLLIEQCIAGGKGNKGK